MEKLNIENAVGKLLIKIGISPAISGYRYLKTAITELYFNPAMNRMTKEVYPTVAKMHNTTPSKCERAIRHAIERAYYKGDIKLLNEILPIYSQNKGKATNGEFISGFAEYLKMKGDQMLDINDYIKEPAEDEPKYICDQCECGIYEGDPVWSINGYTLCEKCAEREYRKLA